MVALEMQAVRCDNAGRSCNGVIDEAAVCVGEGARTRRITFFSNGEGCP